MRGFPRIAPAIATALYLAFFGVVLIRNVVWPVGDETDVLRVAAAALPSAVCSSLYSPAIAVRHFGF
jgi:hypothetical protein